MLLSLIVVVAETEQRSPFGVAEQADEGLHRLQQEGKLLFGTAIIKDTAMGRPAEL